MTETFVIEEFKLPGVEALQQQIPDVQIMAVRARYNESPNPKRVVAWEPQGREIFRAIFNQFGVGVTTHAEIVAFLMCITINGKKYDHQVAQTKLNDYLNTPWWPIVRVDTERGRASHCCILSDIMSEDEIRPYGITLDGRYSERLAKLNTLPLATKAEYTVTIDIT